MELTPGININVKATLSVDNETVEVCARLLSIYIKAMGADRMIIQATKENEYGPLITLMHDEELDIKED